MLQTRKSLKDPRGWRPVYVIEVRECNHWMPVANEAGHRFKQEAESDREWLLKHYDYSDDEIRIAIYIRAER